MFMAASLAFRSPHDVEQVGCQISHAESPLERGRFGGDRGMTPIRASCRTAACAAHNPLAAL